MNNININISSVAIENSQLEALNKNKEQLNFEIKKGSDIIVKSDITVNELSTTTKAGFLTQETNSNLNCKGVCNG